MHKIFIIDALYSFPLLSVGLDEQKSINKNGNALAFYLAENIWYNKRKKFKGFYFLIRCEFRQMCYVRHGNFLENGAPLFFSRLFNMLQWA